MPERAARSSSSRRRSRTCSSGSAAGRPRPPTSSRSASATPRIELARQEDYDYVVTNETGQVERTAERIDEIIADEHADPSGPPGRGLPAVAVTRGDAVELEVALPDGEVAVEPAGGAAVEVAVDAAGGAGTATYTYLVPAALADLEPGEAVLVEFGRRQALGIVARAEACRGSRTSAAKPIVDRVRADGPLLPPLTLRLARWIAEHYLAPPALVLRAMLPPGLLERLELVAELAAPRTGTPGLARAPSTPADADLLEPARAAARARSATWPGRDGRAGLLRRLRALASDGLIEPRMDAARRRRRAALRTLDAPRPPTAGSALATLAPASGQRAGALGPRQRDALARARGARRPTSCRRRSWPAATAAPALAGLVRRGLVEADVRERPRRPLAARPAGRRGGRPAGERRCCPAQAEAVERMRGRASPRGDPRPLLLDGVTGGGKTAIYVEAIAATLERGRPALVLVPEIALALPLVDRLRADLDARVALVHSGLGGGRAGRRVAADPARATSTSSSGRGWRSLAPLADVGLIVVDEEHDAAYKSDRTPRLQARDVAIELAELAGRARRPRLGDAAVESEGRARDGDIRPRRPARAPGRGAAARSRSSTCARSWRPGNAGCCRGRSRPRSARSTRTPASRRSSSSTGAAPRRSSCAATAATSRPAPTASGRSSTTRPARRSAATTAAGPRRSRRAARPAARRGSATSAAARSGSSARSATRFPRSAGRAPRSRRRRASRARQSGSSTPSPTAGSTSSSGRASSPRASTSRRSRSSASCRRTSPSTCPTSAPPSGPTSSSSRRSGGPGGATRPGRAIVQTYQPEHPAIVGGRGAATGAPSTTPSSTCAGGSGRRRSAGWSS